MMMTTKQGYYVFLVHANSTVLLFYLSINQHVYKYVDTLYCILIHYLVHAQLNEQNFLYCIPLKKCSYTEKKI